MKDTQLILVGIAVTGVFIAFALIVIAGIIDNLVKELRYLRGDLQEFKNIHLDVGDELLDKVADKFTKKDGKDKKKKSNGRSAKRKA